LCLRPDWYTGSEPDTWEEYCVSICDHYTDHDRLAGAGGDQTKLYSSCGITPALPLCYGISVESMGSVEAAKAACGTWDVRQTMNDYSAAGWDVPEHPWYGHNDSELTVVQKTGYYAMFPGDHPSAAEIVGQGGHTINCNEEPYNCPAPGSGDFGIGSCPHCDNVPTLCPGSGTCPGFAQTLSDVMTGNPTVTGLCWAPKPGDPDYGVTSGGCCV
jgi:hypothetical protein